MKMGFSAAIAALSAIAIAPAAVAGEGLSLGLAGGEKTFKDKEVSVSGSFVGLRGTFGAEFGNPSGIVLDVGVRAGVDAYDLKGTELTYTCDPPTYCLEAYRYHEGYEAKWGASVALEIGASYGPWRVSAARGVEIIEIGKISTGTYPTEPDWDFAYTNYRLTGGENTSFGLGYQFGDIEATVRYTRSDFTFERQKYTNGSYEFEIEAESVELEVVLLRR